MNRYEAQIVRSLKEGPKSFWRLLDEQDEHIRGFVERLKKLLQEELVCVVDGKFALSEKGKIKYSSLKPYVKATCSHCRGGYNPYAFRGAFEEYAKLVEERPLPNLDFDQGFMTHEDVFARVALMYERGDLEGQEILILGDDDLFSLALCATGFPSKVTVLEVDERLVSFIQKRAREKQFPLEARVYNACDVYPLKEHAFDVFITDPVESEKGLKVTLSRGAQSLKKGGVLYFGLTTIESSWKKWYLVEKMLLEMNFAITDILRRFSSYPDRDNQFDRTYYERTMMLRLLDFEPPLPADADWFRSSFLRCEAVELPVPLVVGSVAFDKDFYLDEETMATPGFKVEDRPGS